WFGIVAELGFIGLLLFAGVVFMAWRSCVRARRLAAHGLVAKELGDFGAGLEMSLVVFAVGGSFVIFQYTEMLWHVVGLTMALHFLTSRELAQRSVPRIGADQVADRQIRTPAVVAGVRRASTSMWPSR